MHLNKISMRNIFTFCSHTVQGQCSALCSLRLAWRRSRRSAFAVTKALSVGNRGHSSVSTVGVFRLLALLLSHPSCPPFFLFLPTPQIGSPPHPTLSSFLSVSICIILLWRSTAGCFDSFSKKFLFTFCLTVLWLLCLQGHQEDISELSSWPTSPKLTEEGDVLRQDVSQFPCAWGWGKRLMVKPWKASSLLCLRPWGQTIFLLSFY